MNTFPPFFMLTLHPKFPHMMKMPVSRINLPTVDSTNTFVHEMLKEEGTDGVISPSDLPGFTLVVADDQTRGRGQKGNSWETEKGKNLTFSLLCHPTFLLAAHQFLISQCMAVAIREALKDYVDGVTVKWPNDIYVGKEKISGTLIECDLQGKGISNCIIGVGINVNQTVFRSDAPNPTSLKCLVGRDVDREEVLTSVMQHFQVWYRRLEAGEEELLREQYKQFLYRRKGMHRYADVRGEFCAEIADVEPTGHLVLRFDTGQLVRYELKEVRFVED